MGTGSSGGVPRIGNNWGKCDPLNPRNRRRRCAMLVERTANSAESFEQQSTTQVLVDCGPDMREQLLSANVSDLDGVVITHSHADHIFGLDDLRQLRVHNGRNVDVYLDRQTRKLVFQAFGYGFEQAAGSSYHAFCNAHEIQGATPFVVSGKGGDIELLPLQVEHGDIHALGIRIGSALYMPDVKTVSLPESRKLLQGIDLLILDCLRRTPHPTHMNLQEALEFIEEVSPARSVLTNLHGDLDYETLAAELPENIVPAYDGMTLHTD